MEYKFGQFTPEHLEKMRLGVELFNQQKYWECHEALEDVWMEDRNDPARNVYWAIIQVAASCLHFREANYIGAAGMLFKAKEKFKRCREQNVLTDIAFKYLDWAELEELVMGIPQKDFRPEDFIPLYEFRFKNYPSLDTTGLKKNL